jgi:hypothetical protein
MDDESARSSAVPSGQDQRRIRGRPHRRAQEVSGLLARLMYIWIENAATCGLTNLARTRMGRADHIRRIGFTVASYSTVIQIGGYDPPYVDSRRM